MTTRTTAKLLLRFRPTDNLHGVSRTTVERLAEELGLNETQVIHFALKRLANEVLPAYLADDGPMTDKDLQAIQRRAGKARGKSVRTSLV